MSITTEQLIALAKEAADLTNVADYVTDATWVSWLNAGKDELHRLVTNKFKATYFRTFDFTLAAGESQVTLPANFWRLRLLKIDPDTPRRRTVRPYNLLDEDRYLQSTLRNLDSWCQDRRYNLLGSRLLKIQAEENASGTYRAYYVPKSRPLALARTMTMDPGDDAFTAGGGPSGGDLFLFDAEALALPLAQYVGRVLSFTDTGQLSSNGDYEVLSVPTTDSFETPPDTGFGGFTATTTAQLVGALDVELEPFSEYVWLTAAIKSLIKEESFAAANMLKDQRNLIRDDLVEALETDEGGPKTVIDTDDDGWMP